MYVVTGATGRTGGRVAHRLLEAGRPVRAVGRSAERLEPLVARGAEAAVGDLRDDAFVRDAFSGALAVYVMIPPSPREPDVRAYQARIAEAMAEAVLIHGVQHVVALSSVGAHLDTGSGIVLGLHDMERKFYAVPDTSVLALRAGYFMDTLIDQIPIVLERGAFVAPIRPDLRFPMVATRDVGDVAADRLLTLDVHGKGVRYVLGPEDVTYPEAARIMGQAVGRPELGYVQISYDEFRSALPTAWGVSENVADRYVDFMRALNDGRVLEEAHRTRESTTPTTLRDFAPEFARAYRGAAEERRRAADGAPGTRS